MKNKTIKTIITASCLVAIFSCSKESDVLFNSKAGNEGPVIYQNNGPGSTQNNPNKIEVSTVSELYSAVNDPDNNGVEVQLSPGTYVLDASYPNGGRLELQTDMKLTGQPGQVEAVLIDQSALPGSSFRLSPTVSTGGIRVGRGTNTIEWLSIKGGALAVNPFSVIESDLIGEHTTVQIAHVKVDCNGSRTGIMLRNRLSEHQARIINAGFQDVEIFGAINPPGTGLSLQNRISEAEIYLDMQGSYIHGNKIGILPFSSGLGNTVENCTTQITSHADRIEGNGCGMDPTGGTNASGLTYANNNFLEIRMFASTLRNNNPEGHPELIPTNGAFPGAVFVTGGYNSLNNIAAYNHVNDNQVRLEFNGCDISNNNGTDIYAFGAWSQPLALLAGTNNLVEIYLRGISVNAIVDAVASVPFEPAGTNVVNVYYN